MAQLYYKRVVLCETELQDQKQRFKKDGDKIQFVFGLNEAAPLTTFGFYSLEYLDVDEFGTHVLELYVPNDTVVETYKYTYNIPCSQTSGLITEYTTVSHSAKKIYITSATEIVEFYKKHKLTFRKGSIYNP